MAQARVGEPLGKAGAGGDIFGKARVIARGESPPCLQAVAAGEPADRAFGGDVDVVRRDLFDAPADFPRRRDRDADVRIGRHRRGPHPLRGEELEFRAELDGRLGHSLQGRNHAVDLRPPGVGRNQNPHYAASASISWRLVLERRAVVGHGRWQHDRPAHDLETAVEMLDHQRAGFRRSRRCSRRSRRRSRG